MSKQPKCTYLISINPTQIEYINAAYIQINRGRLILRSENNDTIKEFPITDSLYFDDISDHNPNCDIK